MTNHTLYEKDWITIIVSFFNITYTGTQQTSLAQGFEPEIASKLEFSKIAKGTANFTKESKSEGAFVFTGIMKWLPSVLKTDSAYQTLIKKFDEFDIYNQIALPDSSLPVEKKLIDFVENIFYLTKKNSDKTNVQLNSNLSADEEFLYDTIKSRYKVDESFNIGKESWQDKYFLPFFIKRSKWTTQKFEETMYSLEQKKYIQPVYQKKKKTSPKAKSTNQDSKYYVVYKNYCPIDVLHGPWNEIEPKVLGRTNIFTKAYLDKNKAYDILNNCIKLELLTEDYTIYNKSNFKIHSEIHTTWAIVQDKLESLNATSEDIFLASKKLTYKKNKKRFNSRQTPSDNKGMWGTWERLK